MRHLTRGMRRNKGKKKRNYQEANEKNILGNKGFKGREKCT